LSYQYAKHRSTYKQADHNPHPNAANANRTPWRGSAQLRVGAQRPPVRPHQPAQAGFGTPSRGFSRQASARPKPYAAPLLWQGVAIRRSAGYTSVTAAPRYGEAAMAVDTQGLEIKLIRRSTGMELDLEPLQGLWTAEQYLRLTDHTRYLVEFTGGRIEVLPMPTQKHQLILAYLYRAFWAFLQTGGGIVLFAALRVQVRADKFREPDLLLLRDANDVRAQDRYWLGADLLVEVVSPDDPARDTVEKVADYAEAGIPEYWIVNPLDNTITVLTLSGNAYATHGVFRRGDTATSRLLAGFAVSVDAVFDAR